MDIDGYETEEMEEGEDDDDDTGSDITVVCSLNSNYKKLFAKNAKKLSQEPTSYLSGCVQECIRRYTDLLMEAFPKDNSQDSNPSISQKRVPVKTKRIQKKHAVKDRAQNDGSPLYLHLGFSKSVLQVKAILSTWDDLLMRAIEGSYLLQLETLKWSITLLNFIRKLSQQFYICAKETTEDFKKLINRKLRVQVTYLDTHHLLQSTRLFCKSLDQSLTYFEGEHIGLLLNLFMDALEILLAGILQSVPMNLYILQDWIFMILFPWHRELPHLIPCCLSTPSLNTVYDRDNILYVPDVVTKQRSLRFIRFKSFFIFRDRIYELLRYEMLRPNQDSSCKSILELISGFWWPIELFEWREIFQYCLSVFSSGIWMQDDGVAVALSDAIVRLPCIYCHKQLFPKRFQQTTRVKPRFKGCRICDHHPPSVLKLKFQKRLKSVKMKEEDCKVLRLVMYKMLSHNANLVQSRFIHMMIRFRKHGNMNLTSFTTMFWKMFHLTTTSVHVKLWKLYGFCTAQRVKPSPKNNNSKKKNTKNSLSVQRPRNVSSMSNSSLQKRTLVGKKSSLQRVHIVPPSISSKQVRTAQFEKSLIKRKSSSALLNKGLKPKRRKLDCCDKSHRSSQSSSSNSNRQIFKKLSQCVHTSSNKKRNSSYDQNTTCPAVNLHSTLPGKLDNSTLFYCKVLYPLHVNYQDDFFDAESAGLALTRHYIMFKFLSKYVDGNVGLIDVLKYHLHLLSRFRSMKSVFLCQRNFKLLADRVKCSVSELFGKHREILSEEMKNLCMDMCFHDDSEATEDYYKTIISDLFLKVRLAVEWTTTQMEDILLRGILKRCVLTMFSDPRMKIIITTIAEFGKWNTPGRLLQVEFPHYYSHLVFTTPPQEMRKLLLNLKRDYSCNPTKVCQLHQQYFHIELFSNLSEQQGKVLKQYDTFFKWFEGSKHKFQRKENLVKVIESYVQLWYTGVLINFERKFSSNYETFSSRRKYLTNWAMLISLMGKQLVTTSKIKIYSTLNSLRSMGPEFHDLLFAAWRAFTNSLDNDSLGQMANQIFAGMMYLNEDKTMERRVVKFFKEVIINREVVIHEYINHLHFLDNKVSDRQIHNKMEQVIRKLRDPKPTVFFYQLVDEIGHENSHVRYRAVSKMRRILQEDVMQLEEFAFENLLFPHYITKLLRHLLFASKMSTDNDMKILCASCIGLIGALDPSRFDLKEQLSINARYGQTIFTVGEPDFIKFFIEELAIALQGSVDTRNFDTCAYCIQEIIKLYYIKSDDLIWTKLSQSTRNLLDPLFTSKYTKEDKPEWKKRRGYDAPIYMSSAGTEFKQWIFHWTLNMVACIQGCTYHFFNLVPCVVEHSEHIALLLLPYVTSYAIMEGTDDDRKYILNEINAVMSNWIQQEVMFTDSEHMDLGDSDDTTIPYDFVDELVHHQMKEETKEQDKVKFSFAATQAVFKALDHLSRLVRHPKSNRMVAGGPDQGGSQIRATQAQQIMPPAARHHTVEAAKPIAGTLQKLCYNILSKAAFRCHNFARSLMYMEEHLQNNPRDLEVCMGNLQRIYVALYDDDSLRGLEKRRGKKCSVLENALSKLSRDKLQEGASLFEKLMAKNPNNLISYQQLILAYVGLDNIDVSELLINGCIAQSPEWSRSFDEAKIEICLKQKNFDELARQVEYQSSEKLSSWGVLIGKAVLNYSTISVQKVQKIVDTARINLITDICSRAALLDMGFYYRHYKDLIRFQLLAEIEEILMIVSRRDTCTMDERVQNLTYMVRNWNRRLKCVHRSTAMFYPVVNFRRTLLDLTKNIFMHENRTLKVLNIAIRDGYMQLSKLESGFGNYTRALEHLSESKRNDSKLSVCYEEGKILFEDGKYDQSLDVLRTAIQSVDPEIITMYKANGNISSEQIRFSKAALLYAKQSDEQQKVVDLLANTSNYKFAIDVNDKSEKNYFYMACYYDRLWSKSEPRNRDSDVLVLLAKNYSISLEHGCKYVYQSLPRLLSLWFDYSAQIRDAPRNSKPSLPVDPRIVRELTGCIKKLLANVPAYIFVLAFTQLISRLCHVNETVWTQLKEILVHMIITHPDQILWMIVNVPKSTYSKRKNRCSEIFQLVEKKAPHLKKIIRNYQGLADKMASFTMCGVPPQIRFLRISEVMPALPKLIKHKEFSSVLIPFQEFMRPILPRGGKYVDSHRAFPADVVYISKILDQVQVMSSLQRPKRVTFEGSNGKFFSMLCKPSDDLRKDAKVMEVNNMVHHYLGQVKESRKRNLIVRTYHVVPLTDNCGLLEWIGNLHGFKPLVTSLLREGLGRKETKELKKPKITQCHRTDTLDKKQNAFRQTVLQHPPVMSHWFLKSFADPQSWYLARTSFVKTTAVMSIIGFMMGLGDRHGENILLDSSNGDTVHVDFNCLFNKGETFDWPERVPFRLTHNMIQAMGPLGYDGVFRSCCEIVMRIIRNYSSSFLLIIEPFMFDPLLEWETSVSSSIKAAIMTGEVNNSKATEHLNNIRDRLVGTTRNMTRERNVALSVEAHVDYLIREATKLDNLCQMYVGWAAFL